MPVHFTMNQYDSTVETIAMYAVTAVMLALATWVGSRGRRWLIVTALVVLVLSLLNAFGAYAAFRM